MVLANDGAVGKRKLKILNNTGEAKRGHVAALVLENPETGQVSLALALISFHI